MSTLESIFWHVLCYSAMPVIILAGFLGVAVVSIVLRAMTKDKKECREKIRCYLHRIFYAHSVGLSAIAS